MRNQKSKLRLAQLDFDGKLNSGLRTLILPPEVPFFVVRKQSLLPKVPIFEKINQV